METKDWWIYNGKENLNRLEKLKENIPPWRDKNKQDHNAKAFIPLSEELLDAVNASIHLRRPLLVTGDPGVGKSSLAKSIANKMNTEFLHWQISSKSVLKDALYSYDALGRLQDMQMQRFYKDTNEKHNKIPTGIENYLKLTELGTAFLQEEKPVVILIDEIDKSDIDLPNDLLHIFEEQEFEIAELKRIKFKKNEEPPIEDALGKTHQIIKGKVICKKNFPIIIMTSNNEREFPPAFLRRCISVEMKMSQDETEKLKQLTEMVKAHFPKNKDGEMDDVIQSFMGLQSGLYSNDQLLNAVHLVLKSKADFDSFKTTVLKTLDG